MERSLSQLTPLQREVLTRTDLNGERHARVYGSLNISRRSFYRQRSSALKTVASSLTRGKSGKVAIGEVKGPETLDLQLGLSRALEQVGDWRRAADHLEGLAELSVDAEARFWVNLRLADVYIEAGRPSQANSKLRAAESIAKASPPGLPDAQALIDLFEAKAALTDDRDDNALHLLRNSLPKVRALHAREMSRRVAESLIQGLLVNSELAHGAGVLNEALACAEEAEELCRRTSLVGSVLANRARMMAALSRVFLWKEPIGAERELLQCYGSASAAGYVYEAATISAHLSGLYRISGRPREAQAIILKTLDAARTLGPSVPLASVLIESAFAAFALKKFDEASRALEEARASAQESDGLLAVGELLGSQIFLARGQYQDALLLAECVEKRFARMGRLRFLGQALTVQAKALYAIGQRRQAFRVIRVAVELLTSVGQPLVLAEAQKMLADPRRFSPAP
jgi:tetratricopeptide (TPR) repeat protein